MLATLPISAATEGICRQYMDRRPAHLGRVAPRPVSAASWRWPLGMGDEFQMLAADRRLLVAIAGVILSMSL